ncbi:MAG: ubiquinone biosynthesis protein UbiH [Nitrosomonadales bacterium]|nr:MAG: ubiquinone biosynthesis protein UbiH [Nitrosomonadales bacterium]
MASKHYDLIIIGGGPVGMSLSLALRNSGLSVLLLEARGAPEKKEDPRPLAFSHGSRLILQRLGVWESLPKISLITAIHISNRGGFGRTVLTACEVGVPALGYVVAHHDVFRAMHERLQDCRIDYLTEAQVIRLESDVTEGRGEFRHNGVIKQVTANLLVLADGGRLTGQVEGITQHVHDYEQWAIVARIETSLPQCGTAYERFTSDGPVAFLPLDKYFSLVWSVSPSAAQEILSLDDVTFLARLHHQFGDRLGKFIGASKRSGFPLALKYAEPTTACRVALIGNAAQTLHPVAGQGFNLGLRDAWELSGEIIIMPSEVGSPTMLSKYRDKRQTDSGAGRIFTDSLVKLFSNDDILLRGVCGIGLSALDCLPSAKRFVAKRMMFGSRG